MAYLKVFSGNMFSCKSSNLIKDVTQFADLSTDIKCIIVNSCLDTRDTDNIISSHSSSYKGISDKVKTVSVNTLLELNVDDYQVIAIDEANFFSDLKDAVSLWLSKDKHLIVAGLDGDYLGNKFGQISELLNLADEFIKLRSFCSICLKESNCIITPNNLTYASFTSKISGSNSLIDVGNCDKYIPTCRKHHKELLKNWS